MGFKKGEFKMEKEQSCFEKVMGYLKSKFNALMGEDTAKDESKSATLKSNTDTLPPARYYDPLLPMYYGDSYMDYMGRYDRMMMCTGMYDPELDDYME